MASEAPGVFLRPISCSTQASTAAKRASWWGKWASVVRGFVLIDQQRTAESRMGRISLPRSLAVAARSLAAVAEIANYWKWSTPSTNLSSSPGVVLNHALSSLAESTPTRQDLRQEPSAGKPLAGICVGGTRQLVSLPRPYFTARGR